jgi:hypothetical protein
VLFGLHGNGVAFVPTVAEYEALIGNVFPCAAGKTWAKALLVPTEMCSQQNTVATRYLNKLCILPGGLVVCGMMIFTGYPRGCGLAEGLSDETIESLGRDLVDVVLGLDGPLIPDRPVDSSYETIADFGWPVRQQ